MISTVTGLWAALSGFQILQEARDFSLPQNMLTDSGAHPVPFAVGLMWG
jgi:hypothetical protein